MPLKPITKNEKKDYTRQPCPVCTTNFDFPLKGRTITCICGCKIAQVADKTGRSILKRVG